MKRSHIQTLFFILLSNFAFAQLVFEQNDSVPVKINGVALKNAWAGGINYGQYSAIDLNLDGTKDLVVFDRSGNKILPFINNGTPNSIDYTYAPQYLPRFPKLQDWALFVDYNNDNKADIFSYSQGGFSVFTNISAPGIGLFFRLDKYIVKSHYSSLPKDFLGLYVSRVDIPAIADIDFDGDIDVLTFDISSGTEVEFHRNMSMENYGVSDSLNDFKLSGSCWGNFMANATNTVVLNIACRRAPGPRGYDTSSVNKVLHVGSTELAIDIDNDNDYDFLLGGVSTYDLNLLTNGGNSSSAQISAQENNFPQANVPVNVTIFPAAFHLDVNNDSNKDLIVAPNAGNSSENFTSSYYYRDEDTSGASNFKYQTNSFLQDQMIEVGEGCYPTFFDYNSDGLQDLFIGNYGYYSAGGSYSCKLALFKNIGTPSQPEFELVTRDYAALSAFNLANLIVTFGDLDNDGDLDMVIGTNSNGGTLLYFENTSGSGNVANFVLSNPSLISLIGQFPAPQLVDVNRDGKLDLLIGSRNGTVSYYENSSTVGNIVFTLVTATLGNVNVAPNGGFVGYSVPKLIDENGSYHLYIGNVDGHIYYYDSIDGNLQGTFALKDSAYRSINEGDRVAPAFSDLNNDGYLDMVLGNYSGGLAYFKGRKKVTGIATLGQQSLPNLYLYPNPSRDFIRLKVVNDFPGSKKLIKVYTVLGELVLQQEVASNLIELNTHNLNEGIYYCKVELKDTYLLKKFSILK